MEWLNYLSKREKISTDEYITFLCLLAPFSPHITEELCQIYADQDQQKSAHHQWGSIHKLPWPKFDEQYLKEEQVKVVVQINGKVRDVLLIQKDIVSSREAIEKMALSSSKAQKFLEGKIVKKTVYIEGKIISLVV